MAYSTSCLKFVVLAFSVIFTVSGVLLVVFNVANLVHFYTHNDFVPTSVSSPVLLLALIGLAACFVAALGWIGAMAGNTCRLHTFSLFLVIVILVEFGGAVWTLTARADFEDSMTSAMELSLSSYNTDEEIKKDWKSLQEELNCCGVDGPGDYRKFGQVSWSCCLSETEHHGSCQTLRQRGCRASLSLDIRERLLLVALLAFASALGQISGVLCSCCLTNSMKNEERRNKFRNKIAEIELKS